MSRLQGVPSATSNEPATNGGVSCLHLTVSAILATVTDMYTRAIADLERRRGLREITDGQYLEAKRKIEVERYETTAAKSVRLFAGTRRLH
jgi:hypothetical protein